MLLVQVHITAPAVIRRPDERRLPSPSPRAPARLGQEIDEAKLISFDDMLLNVFNSSAAEVVGDPHRGTKSQKRVHEHKPMNEAPILPPKLVISFNSSLSPLDFRALKFLLRLLPLLLRTSRIAGSERWLSLQPETTQIKCERRLPANYCLSASQGTSDT